MGLQHVAPSIETMNKNIVMKATWGHLAPERNKTYRGKVIWALGCGYEYNMAYSRWVHCPDSEEKEAKRLLDIWRHKYFSH